MRLELSQPRLANSLSLECTPALVRPEGNSELLGEIAALRGKTCHLRLRLNTHITNRKRPGGLSDIVLFSEKYGVVASGRFAENNLALVIKGVRSNAAFMSLSEIQARVQLFANAAGEPLLEHRTTVAQTGLPVNLSIVASKAAIMRTVPNRFPRTWSLQDPQAGECPRGRIRDWTGFERTSHVVTIRPTLLPTPQAGRQVSTERYEEACGTIFQPMCGCPPAIISNHPLE